MGHKTDLIIAVILAMFIIVGLIFFASYAIYADVEQRYSYKDGVMTFETVDDQIRSELEVVP